MLTFTEYLKNRDPALYESMVNEVSWQDVKDFGNKAMPYLGGAAIATSLAANAAGGYKFYNNYQQAALEKELASRPTSVNSQTKADKDYAPEEILAKVMITPRELIKNSSNDPEKWQKDFDKLQTPEKDIGISTHKDNFDKPLMMYVVKPESLRRVVPDAGAYASRNKNYIVMPSDQFEVLPTNNSVGKLTKWGIDTLSHELRHTTQSREAIPDGRNVNITGRTGKEGYSQYMKNPAEMGVRLAAIKNLLSRDNAIKNTRGTYGIYAQEVFEELPDDENYLLDIVTNPQAYKKYLSPSSKWLVKNGNDQFAQHIIEDFVKELKKQNNDVKSLLNFIESLPDNEKQSYLDELQQNMHTVVKDDTGLKNRLQQRLANFKKGINT